MERFVPSPLAVRPPQAIVFPSGETATANIIPIGPSPIGGLKILMGLPVESSQSGTVLSHDPVTINWFLASIPILLMNDVCIPISMRRKGSLGISDGSVLSLKSNTESIEINKSSEQFILLFSTLIDIELLSFSPLPDKKPSVMSNGVVILFQISGAPLFLKV